MITTILLTICDIDEGNDKFHATPLVRNISDREVQTCEYKQLANTNSWLGGAALVLLGSGGGGVGAGTGGGLG